MDKKLVFLDTDIGPDCDDTAALAILLGLCRDGFAELVGVTHCTGSPYGLPTIDAICRCFGQTPSLGTCADKDFLSDEFALLYTKPISERFPNSFPANTLQPDALQTIVCSLQNLPDDSVTLIAIGPLNNIARFLLDPVAGPLMHRKVCRIVTMAGCFEGQPGFTEWNIEMDISAAQTLVGTWQKPIDFCPLEAMLKVCTGKCLQGLNNPVALAYELHTKGTMQRPSWDLETVIAAILGAESPYEWSPRGYVEIDDRGVTRFIASPNGSHRYLRLTGSTEDAAAFIEEHLRRAVSYMK